MSDSPIPDLSAVASPPPESLSFHDLNLAGSPLAKGGQAVVHAARITTEGNLDRVVVKQPSIKNTTVHRETVGELLSEAETWEMLARREREKPRWDDYEHIVGIVATGEEPFPWIAMEYMDAGSLEMRLKEYDEGLPVKEALWIGECLCRGVGLAHNEGTAHLDLKPANILFRETASDLWDVPKIADWGIARDLATKQKETERFSPAYGAPEQFNLDHGVHPDNATDIYQLGAVIYAMLTGKPPHGSGITTIKTRHSREETPTPPSTRRGEVPTDVDDCVLKALKARKADRYRSVSEFEAKLRSIRNSISATDADASIQEWSMFQVDTARTGYHPQNFAPAPPVTEDWRFETSKCIKSSPAVADGTVFVGNDYLSWGHDRNLYAVDANTGEEVWHFETKSSICSSPAVADGTVFVGSFDGNLYAVDATTGEEAWHFETGDRIQSSPAVADGTVFVGSNDGCLYAVDASTGEEVWDFETGNWVHSSPAVANGTAFVGSWDGNLYAVDAGSGKEIWHFETEFYAGQQSINSSPAVADGTVFVGSHDRTLYALDAITGEEVWKFETGGSIRSSPAVADGTVFVSQDKILYALDTDSGQKSWQFHTGPSSSSPTVADGTVFVGSNHNTLYAVDRVTGEEVWKFETGGSIRSSPVVANGTVYVGSNDNNLYAISEE